MVKVEFESEERCHFIILPKLTLELYEVKGKCMGEADISEEDYKEYQKIGKKAGFKLRKKKQKKK